MTIIDKIRRLSAPVQATSPAATAEQPGYIQRLIQVGQRRLASLQLRIDFIDAEHKRLDGIHPQNNAHAEFLREAKAEAARIRAGYAAEIERMSAPIPKGEHAAQMRREQLAEFAFREREPSTRAFVAKLIREGDWQSALTWYRELITLREATEKEHGVHGER